MFDSWLANHGAALRVWLTKQTPELLHPVITDVPVWALVLIAFIVLLAAIWAVKQFAEQAAKALIFIIKSVRHPIAAAKDIVAPAPAAKQQDIQNLDAHMTEQDKLLAAMMARLDKLGEARLETGGAPLGATELTRRDDAAAAIVAEGTPASDAAAREVAAGDVNAAIAILERDARSDVAAAAEKWLRIGDLVRGVDTAKSRAAYEEAFKLQPGDFWTCVELARLRQEAGDLLGARTAAEASQNSAHGLRDQTVAADTLGDVLREAGDLAGATARYQDGLGVSERLARDNPGSAQAQRDLSVSYNKLGDVLREAGDLAGATARYETGLSVSERLARDNPGSAEAQRDLSVSYDRLGDVLREAGDLAGATARYQDGLGVRERLARGNPSSAEAQRDLSVSYNKLGDVLREAGDLAGAISCYEQSLPLAEMIAAANPSHPGLARDLDITKRRLAQLRAKL